MTSGEDHEIQEERLALLSVLQELTVAALDLFDPNQSMALFLERLAERLSCVAVLVLVEPAPLAPRLLDAAGLSASSRALPISPRCPVAAGDPAEFAAEVEVGGQAFSLLDTGEMKAKALISTVTLCTFGKYAVRNEAERAAGPRLLRFRFERKLSAEQVRQVFHGVVKDRPGYTEAQLEAFLGLLPAASKGSILELRADATGKLEVLAGEGNHGTVTAPELANAVWAGLEGGD